MAKGKRSRSEPHKLKLSPKDEQLTFGKHDAPKPKRKRSRAQDIEEEMMEVPVHREEEELTAEEKRKIERKQKKERKKKEKLLRETDVLVEKVKPQQSSANDLALEYLTRWSKKHKEWKFQKTRQTWLLQHMYDCDKISDKHFTVLLKYLDGLKGNAREVTIQKAEALIKELETTDDSTEDSPAKIERIRQVLQLLS
ncbi:uncharacterized protein C7orf50 [Carcharodon carcharias]|uniref:uncharacterized protein C7orf50 n=1 Tax=Carcharodon carcharias TaxID=13397 RepID=UPI001B7DC3EE|nr:uncharacterized protein C7orf50 [Carcharodon carcharias]